jgi:hypothetical protein
MLLTGMSKVFFYGAHLARYDVMVAAAGFGAIALYLVDARRAAAAGRRLTPLSVLAGLLVGLAFEIHPNAMIFGPVIVALFVVDHGWAFVRQGRLWGFLAGAAVGPALYASLHILPYPETYAAITRVAFGASKLPALLNPGLLPASLVGTLNWTFLTDAARLPLLLAALALLAWRRSANDLRALTIAGALFAQFVLLLPYQPVYYAILLAPAMDLVLALGLAALAGAARPMARPAVIGTVVAGCLLAISLGASLRAVTYNPMHDFEATIARIRAAAPPGSVLMADSRYWWGLTDYRYLTWYEPAYYRRHAPGSTLADALRALGPTVLVIDDHQDKLFADDPSGFEPWAQALALPRAELDSFLSQHAELVSSFQSDLSGPVRVYRVRGN